MSLFCKACHRIIEKQALVCNHDSFELVNAKIEFPPFMGIGKLSLQFEGCIIPGEKIRFYKTVESNTGASLLFETYSSEIIDNSKFEEHLSKVAQLQHTNISKTIEYGALESGIHYVVSKYPYGKSLAALMDSQGEIKPDIAVHLFNQLLDGLIALNQNGLMHGNLMPANCFVVEDPEIPNKLELSGISLPKNCFTHLTDETYSEVVSPMYLSPERIEGGKAKVASEIYSVGAMMYEALTGLPAYTGRSAEDLHKKHIEAQLLPLRGVAPELDIPALIESLVLRALNRNEAGRFASFEEMQKQLLYAAQESRIYLPKVASKNYTPDVFHEQSDKPPEIPKSDEEIEAEREAQRAKEEEEEIKAEAAEIDQQIEVKAKEMKSSMMLLMALIAVMGIGGAAFLFSQGSDEDKGSVLTKQMWEQKMSAGDTALDEKKYDQAISTYNEALTSAEDIEDDNAKKIETLSKLLKAYEGKGNKAKVESLRKELEKLEKARLKKIETE